MTFLFLVYCMCPSKYTEYGSYILLCLFTHNIDKFVHCLLSSKTDVKQDTKCQCKCHQLKKIKIFQFDELRFSETSVHLN